MKFLKYLKGRPALDLSGPFPRDMTLEEFGALSEGCLFCGSMNVYAGPQGGLNTNFECDNCGAYYNLANISPPFGCQIIHGPSRTATD